MISRWKLRGHRCPCVSFLKTDIGRPTVLSPLSHGNNAAVVTAGHVYDELQLSGSFLPVSPD